MVFVDQVEKDGIRTSATTWEDTAGSIEELSKSNGGEVGLHGPDGAVMILSYSPNLGYYVVAREPRELGELLLIDDRNGDEIVTGVIGGSPDSWPRLAFIDKSSALRAANEFYLTGHRASSLSWTNPGELISKYHL